MKEFKKFISKGNVMEMAVGLIMATYFGAIIKSFVTDIIMPPIGNLLGGVDFAELKNERTEFMSALSLRWLNQLKGLEMGSHKLQSATGCL